jgi:hypothetical protein
LVYKLKNKHTCILRLISQKLVYVSQWKTQGGRSRTFSCVLTIVVNIGVVINVVNHYILVTNDGAHIALGLLISYVWNQTPFMDCLITLCFI